MPSRRCQSALNDALNGWALKGGPEGRAVSLIWRNLSNGAGDETPRRKARR
jgi:hypothetical protein